LRPSAPRSFTRQLLAFSRQQVLEPVAVDLNEATKRADADAHPADREDIEIVVSPPDGLATVLADRAQIEQVIINLALNARDAMATGGTLTIETRNITLGDGYADEHATVEPGDYVLPHLTDTGGGIRAGRAGAHLRAVLHDQRPSAMAPAWASPPSMASSPSPRATSGSTPSPGSAPPSRSTSLPARPPPSAPTTTGRRPRCRSRVPRTVLLCEDEQIVRHLIERILTDEGYTVIATSRPARSAPAGRRAPTGIDVLVSDNR